MAAFVSTSRSKRMYNMQDDNATLTAITSDCSCKLKVMPWVVGGYRYYTCVHMVVIVRRPYNIIKSGEGLENMIHWKCKLILRFDPGVDRLQVLLHNWSRVGPEAYPSPDDSPPDFAVDLFPLKPSNSSKNACGGGVWKEQQNKHVKARQYGPSAGCLNIHAGRSDHH